MANPRTSGRKKRQVEAEGMAHIKATFNNTIITITDAEGGTVAWASAGKAGFKGSKKSTPFAATIAAEQVGREAAAMGMKRVHVRVQGPGSGRESAIQALQGGADNTFMVLLDEGWLDVASDHGLVTAACVRP